MGASHARALVTEPAGWDAAVATAVDTSGGLDVLVNDAGIVNYGPAGAYTHDAWARIMAINLTGVFNGITAATEALEVSGKGGSIINVSSTTGLIACENVPGYVAST